MPSPARDRALRRRHKKLLTHERDLWAGGCVWIAGLDEVGAGPLAGPLFAACVVLDPKRTDHLVGVNDSKQLTANMRNELDLQIRGNVLAFAIGECSVEEIDTINIRNAAFLGMQRALAAVEMELGTVHHLLVDAHKLDVDRAQTPLIKGDSLSLSIAAASIIAKVARDRVMNGFATTYPGYGFERHKGYATADHREALEKLGPCPIHRRSFEPVRTREAVASSAPSA